MISVLITYNDDKQIEKVRGIVNPFLTFKFINVTTRKGRREGWTLKNYWGASLDPFAIIVKNEKPIKAFYSENCDVFNELFNYLNNIQYK